MRKRRDLPSTAGFPCPSRIDVLTLGNAIVDVLAQTDEAFLVAQGVHKGAMQLIDEARAEELYGAMGPATIVSGGSAANTAVGRRVLRRSGPASSARSGTTRLGRLFAHDLKAIDVALRRRARARTGPATARSFILVTPDGERTMNTYLGACQNLTARRRRPDDRAGRRRSSISKAISGIRPAAKEAFRKAVRIAHEAGNRVALTLSDAFCVDRYRDEFLGLIRDGSLDILFANIHELQSLYGTADADTALAALRDEGVLGVVTRSAEGALVVTRGETRGGAGLPGRARGRHDRRRRSLRGRASWPA